MKKSSILKFTFSYLVLMTLYNTGYSQDFEWVQVFEGSSSDEGKYVCTDPSGNVYCIGNKRNNSLLTLKSPKSINFSQPKMNSRSAVNNKIGILGINILPNGIFPDYGVGIGNDVVGDEVGRDERALHQHEGEQGGAGVGTPHPAEDALLALHVDPAPCRP